MTSVAGRGSRGLAGLAAAVLLAGCGAAEPTDATFATPEPVEATSSPAPAPSTVAAAAPAGSTRPSAEAREQSSLRWVPCGIEHPGYECATFRVPLDYDRPDAGSIRLAVNRLPATSPEGRIGSVFVNLSQPFGRVAVGVLPFAQTFTVPDDPALPRDILLQAVGIKPTSGVGNVSNAVWLEF